MRNGFFLCVVVSAILFVWPAMGPPLPVPIPPFGLERDHWLFVGASGAVVWPSSPFLGAA